MHIQILLPIIYSILLIIAFKKIPNYNVEEPWVKEPLKDFGLMLIFLFLMFVSTDIFFNIFNIPFFYIMLLVLFGYVFLPIMYVKIRKYPLSDIGLTTKNLGYNIFIGLAVGLLTALLLDSIADPIYGYFGKQTSNNPSFNLGTAIMLMLGSAIQQPVFNGLLQPRCERLFKNKIYGFIFYILFLNLVVTFYLEGYSHMTGNTWLPQFFSGGLIGAISMGILFRKTKSLVAPAVAHGFANIIGKLI